MEREKLIEMLNEEREFQKKWDAKPSSERAIKDADKTPETWAYWMEAELAKAKPAMIGSCDKSEAMKHIYKTVALGMAALEFYDVPEEWLEERYKGE